MERERLDAAGRQAPVPQEDLVLVVDDEPAIAEAIEFLVEQAGYQVRVAHSGNQALTQIQQYWPAVVISDVMMPQMDGPTLIATLRAQAASWQLPMPAVLLMTAASARAVEGVGADAIIQKPFDIETMEGMLRSLMHHEPP